VGFITALNAFFSRQRHEAGVRAGDSIPHVALNPTPIALRPRHQPLWRTQLVAAALQIGSKQFQLLTLNISWPTYCFVLVRLETSTS
jgi:hypothetical protein